MNYLPWRFAWHFEKTYKGNHALGIEVNTHPRFREYIINLWWWSVGPTWHREADHTPLDDGTHSVYVDTR